MRSSAALVALVLAVASPAFAGDRHALVLPVKSGGFIPNREATEKTARILIENRLRSTEYQIANGNIVSAEEATCDKDDCLKAIADKARLDVVVASGLFNNLEVANAYMVTARVYVRGRQPAVVFKKSPCPNCSEDQAQNQLVALTQDAINETAAPKKGGPDPVPTTPDRPYMRPWLLGIGGALVGVSAITLGIGAWQATTFEGVECDSVCERRRPKLAIGLSFTVAGLALAGGAVAIHYGLKRKP